jgi:plastocyanin
VGKRRNWGRISRSFIPALVIALFVLGVGAAAAKNSAAQTSAATVNVEVGDRFFNPAQLTVNVGDTVVWTNKGQLPHDVTADNGAFVSPRRMANGQSFSFTVTTPGTYSYQCTIHSNMTAVLNVVGAAPAAVPRTGAGGMAGSVLVQWQQLAAIVVLVGGGAALLVLRRLRRAEER